MNNINLLLKHEHKKNSYTLIFMVINLAFLIFCCYQAVLSSPRINDLESLYNYISNIVYQLFAVMLFFTGFASFRAIDDVKRHRYLFSYPLKELEIYTAIKLRYSKNLLVTVASIVLPATTILIDSKVSIYKIIFFIMGMLLLGFLCYSLCDLIVVTLFIVTKSKIITQIAFAFLGLPMMIFSDSTDAVNVVSFYDNNKAYINIIDRVFPYCRFFLESLFNSPGTPFVIMTIVVSLILSFLSITFNDYLLKIAFHRIIEREDNKKSQYSKGKDEAIKPRRALMVNVLKEYRFIIREHKMLQFSLLSFIIIAFTFFGVISLIPTVNEWLSKMSEGINQEDAIRINKYLLMVALTALSLFVGWISYTLHVSRIRVGKDTLPFEKYLLSDSRNMLYSIIITRVIGDIIFFTVMLFCTFLITSHYANIFGRFVIMIIPAAIMNIISVAILDLIVDVVIPNITTKGIVYIGLDLLKLVINVSCRVFYLVLQTVLCYFVYLVLNKSIMLPSILISGLFLILMLLLLNSSFIDKRFWKIGC